MVSATATKTNSRRRFKTMQPMFAVILTIDGKRQVVSDITDRLSARYIASELNRDSRKSGFVARVRPIAVRAIGVIE